MDVLVRETWSGATAFWHELPRTLAAGALVVAASAPLAAALVTDAPRWLAAAAVLPLMLALTGLASVAAPIAQGDQPSLAELRRVDPLLALLLSVAGLALLTPWGALPAAAVVIVGPFALAYGAVRGKRGLTAVRGGAILAAYRPSWALTLTALTVLAGFAAVASAGVLALLVAPLLVTIAARQTTTLLTEIDARQATPPTADIAARPAAGTAGLTTIPTARPAAMPVADGARPTVNAGTCPAVADAGSTAASASDPAARPAATPQADPALPWGTPATAHSGDSERSSDGGLWTTSNCGQPTVDQRRGVSA